jgi:hypothetical protein
MPISQRIGSQALRTCGTLVTSIYARFQQWQGAGDNMCLRLWRFEAFIRRSERKP